MYPVLHGCPSALNVNAFASRSRLRILECMQQGISNPGEIARKLKRHRSTIEKHLRVLLRADMMEKVPSLTKHFACRHIYLGSRTAQFFYDQPYDTEQTGLLISAKSCLWKNGFAAIFGNAYLGCRDEKTSHAE